VSWLKSENSEVVVVLLVGYYLSNLLLLAGVISLFVGDQIRGQAFLQIGAASLLLTPFVRNITVGIKFFRSRQFKSMLLVLLTLIVAAGASYLGMAYSTI